jgi:hypothetical protein
MPKTTNKPCPGCGETPDYPGRPGFRNVGEVCPKCKDDLKTARSIVEAEHARVLALKEAKRTMMLSGRYYDFQGYYERGPKGHQHGLRSGDTDDLRKVRLALYEAVSTPLPTGKAYTGGWREFPPGVLEALEAYDVATRAAMNKLARLAYEDGCDALRRMARGELSPMEFEDMRKPR